MAESIHRPWGYYTVLTEGDGFLVKTITVKPEQKLSVQSHNFRKEHWIILKGYADVLKGSKNYVLKEGECIDINEKEIHSLSNNGNTDLIILEVQRGSVLSEDDIIRYKDIYGRV